MYFSPAGMSLRAIAARVEAGDKVYDDEVMFPVAELSTVRDYHWSRGRLREGSVPVGPPGADGCPRAYSEEPLEGPERWDALSDWMKRYGWRCDPAHVDVGRDGRVKLSEGNHRLAVAESLGIREVPVRFHAVLDVHRTSESSKEPRRLAGSSRRGCAR